MSAEKISADELVKPTTRSGLVDGAQNWYKPLIRNEQAEFRHE
jgi:hypothetical protein